jgi:hypothetical protein
MDNREKKEPTQLSLAHIIARKNGLEVWNPTKGPICVGTRAWLEGLKRRWSYEADPTTP